MSSIKNGGNEKTAYTKKKESSRCLYTSSSHTHVSLKDIYHIYHYYTLHGSNLIVYIYEYESYIYDKYNNNICFVSAEHTLIHVMAILILIHIRKNIII